MTNPKEAKRRAWAMREEWRARGEFKQADFRAALFPVLADLADPADGALMTLVDETADEVDRESLAKTPDDQREPSGFDLVGEYRLGDGRRIAKGEATQDHMQEALRLDDERISDLQRAKLRVGAAILAFGDFDPEMTPQEEQRCDAIIADIEESIPELYLRDSADWRSRDRRYDIIMTELRRRIEELD
jgi:hypothetical protein